MKKISTKHNAGITLMELILATALLSVIAAASTGMVYWQMRTQSYVAQSAMVNNKLTNLQIMMSKVLRSINPLGVTIQDNSIINLLQDDPLEPTLQLFEFTDNSIVFKNDVIIDNVIASFSVITASGTFATTDHLATDTSQLIKIEVSTTAPQRRNLRFLVRPRGMVKND